MEELEECALIKYPPNALYQIRKLYNLEQPGRMKEAVDILEEWIKKQEHFVSKNFDRNYLEILILNCKGSIEKAKTKIDRLCTLRTLAPEYFGAELMEVKLNVKKCIYSTMPMLTPDYNRIYVSKGLKCDFVSEDHFNIYRDYIISTEFLLRTAYWVGSIIIIDLREVNMTNFLSTFNFAATHKFMIILREGYGMRINAIHLLSNSKLFEKFLSLLKPVVPHKIANRMYGHSSLESLHKIVPRELLTKDLGGEEPTLEELHYRNFLEILIIGCKGSLEKAKMKIDKLCTMRTLIPDFFESELMEVKLNRTRCHFAVMPWLTPDYYKIFVIKVLPKQLNSEDHLNVIKDWIFSQEFLQRISYCLGFIIIIDFRGCNMKDVVVALNINHAQRYLNIVRDGYGIRINSFHVISESKLIEQVVALYKTILPGKLANRVYVHCTLESLHKMVPRKLLCEELGGDEESLEEMHNKRIETVSSKEHMEYMKEVLKQRTDESKRIGGAISEDYLPGTFRSLNVD